MDNQISDRGHLACDLKWWYTATWGIIIFPKMQQLSLLENVYSLVQISQSEIVLEGQQCPGKLNRKWSILWWKYSWYGLNQSTKILADYFFVLNFKNQPYKIYKAKEILFSLDLKFRCSTYSIQNSSQIKQYP